MLVEVTGYTVFSGGGESEDGNSDEEEEGETDKMRRGQRKGEEKEEDRGRGGKGEEGAVGEKTQEEPCYWDLPWMLLHPSPPSSLEVQGKRT